MRRDGVWRRAALGRARVLAIVGESRRGRAGGDVARAVLAGGVRFLELRLKGRPPREVYEAASELAPLCADAGALLVVNDDPGVAVAAGADGVHVGADDLPPEAARRVVGPEAIVGATVHDAREAARAVAAGADYAGVGTVFPSALKPGLRAGGPEVLRALLPALGPLPAYAIGGITLDNVAAALATGVHGVAVGSALTEAEDVEAAARAFVEATSR